MRNYIFSFSVLTVALLTPACQKENATAPRKEEFSPMTVNAIAESVYKPDGVKAQMSYWYELFWQGNDKIYVADSNNHDTFTLKDGAGTSEGTFVQDGNTVFGDLVEAYYPTSLVVDGSLVWPSVQTGVQNVPLYCKKALENKNGETFRFSSLGALLQIVFNTAVENTTLKSIEISDGDKTLSGAFRIEDGKAIVTAGDKAGITLDLGDGVALGKGANIFYISIPAGNYQDLTLVFTDVNGRKCIMTKGKINVDRNVIGTLTLTASKFKYYILNGLFSVGEEKYVRFSGGNLYCKGGSFHTEDKQYSYSNSADHGSQFYWNSDAAEATTRIGAGGPFFTDNSDFVVDGFKGLFRTLSKSEWGVLLDRSDRSRYNVTVCGQAHCLILAPDDWKGGIADSYTADAWAEAEKEGIVCLPPSEDGSVGSYWSCTREETTSSVNFWYYTISDGNYSTNTYTWDRSSNGETHSIRLVTDVND